MVAGWLAAGVVDRGRFAPTEEGTPQGGVVSPMLLNIALHGMEEAAGVRYTRRDPHGAHVVSGAPVLVRYADDFVVMCHTRDQAEQVWQQLGEWLAPRGLAFNEDKTHIVHVERGSTSWGSTSVAMTASYSSNPARRQSGGSGNGSPMRCAPYRESTPQR
jgi:RNA-directed DNA polymerase